MQFSEWQNELLESEDVEPGKKFWRQQKKMLSFPHIPGEKSPALTDSLSPFTIETHSQFLTLALSNKIHQFSQELDVTEPQLLFACWQLLLWRLSGQQQLSTGMVCNGRKYEELQQCLGLFTTTLPITTFFEENVSFSEFLTHIITACEEIDAWQEYFLSEEEPAESDRCPFPISFEYVELPAPFVAETMTFSLTHLSTCAEPFKIKLFYVKHKHSAQLIVHYDPQNFAADTIQRLAGYYQTVVSNALNAPDSRLSQLQILSEDEIKWLQVDVNNTAGDFPDICFHTFFEQQVALTPENIALECEHQIITYAELNRRANRLAYYLRKQQIGPETLVALYLQRSIEVVVAILGVLKAGGAYVPLEPGLPRDRLQFQLEDTQASLVITQRQLAESFPVTQSSSIIYLDELTETLAQEPETNPENLAIPTNLVYIIYTSGSTGTPKGVMITHQGLMNYLSWASKAYRIAEGQGSPVHSPLGFDLTITSLLLPLIAGQKAILLPENLGVSALGDVLKQQQNLSLVKLTPSHLRILNRWIEPQQAKNKTQAFILGGEALSSEIIVFWQQHAPETRIINEYGPTESVVGCCTYEVSSATACIGDLPIGRPIMNTSIYILDTHFNFVPMDTVGELYIGGSGLARGYLDRPDMTAERFLPNPFSKEPGARLYRTGDLASYQPDGNIRFHGRNDQQVKIRGFRIELNEIVVVLKQHPAVRDCLVRPYKDTSGEQNLVAYIVVMDLQKEFSENDLRQLGKQKLPEYMLPTIFIPLSSFPLTVNGKMDLAALPDPTKYQRRSRMKYTAPRTEREQQLTAIWQEVLHIEKIGIQDNFFDLGGNSFLLIEITSKIQKNIDADVTLLDMFEHPTISSQAQYISQKQQQQQQQPDARQQLQERACKQKAAMRATKPRERNV